MQLTISLPSIILSAGRQQAHVNPAGSDLDLGVFARVMQVPASIARLPAYVLRLSSPELRSKQRHLELHVPASLPRITHHHPHPPTTRAGTPSTFVAMSESFAIPEMYRYYYTTEPVLAPPYAPYVGMVRLPRSRPVARKPQLLT